MQECGKELGLGSSIFGDLGLDAGLGGGSGSWVSDLGVQSREFFSSEILDLWALGGGQGFGTHACSF